MTTVFHHTRWLQQGCDNTNQSIRAHWSSSPFHDGANQLASLRSISSPSEKQEKCPACLRSQAEHHPIYVFLRGGNLARSATAGLRMLRTGQPPQACSFKLPLSGSLYPAHTLPAALVLSPPKSSVPGTNKPCCTDSNLCRKEPVGAAFFPSQLIHPGGTPSL